MKKTVLAILPFALLLAVGACGLRGNLERPDPLFGEVGENDPEAELVEEDQVFDDDPQALTEPRFNEYGGEIPTPVPTEDVEEEGLPPPVENPENE